MDTYEIVELDEDGSGYVVFHWADGSTTGQQMRNMPVHDKAEFDLALYNLMLEVSDRLNREAAPKIVDIEVTKQLGKSRPIDDLRNVAIAAQAELAAQADLISKPIR